MMYFGGEVMLCFWDLCRELSNCPYKIKWEAQFIVRDQKTFSQEDFDNLANSGCNGLEMGIEAGNEEVRDHMRKKFSNDDIIAAGLQLNFVKAPRRLRLQQKMRSSNFY